jgi:hypothetical protein
MEPTRKPHFSFKAELHILLIPKKNVLAFRSFPILLAMKDKAKGNPNLLLQIMTTCMLAPNQLQFLHFKHEKT